MNGLFGALLFVVGGGLGASVAQAREFTFTDVGFGTYIRGEIGTVQRGNASFADSSGSNVSFDLSRSSSAGGEFGLFWASSRSVFRGSVQALIPKSLSGVKGSGAGGTQLYTLDSKVLAVVPQANLDLFLKQWASSRFLLSFGGGLAFATTTNTYTFIGTPFSGVSDYTETGKGQGLMLQTSAGYEFMFADHVTLGLDIGYRYCKIASLTSPNAQTTITGSVAEGGTLKNNDGSDRSLDLGGLFGGIGFRFYF